MNIILTLAEDRGIVESLRAMLPKTDLLLVEKSVSDALRRLISLRADVILLDDGRQFGLDALRQLSHAAPTVPVIALLSTNHADTIAAYTMAGARTCIVKPFQLDELEAAIEHCATNEYVAPATADPSGPPSTANAVTQHQMALRWMSRSTAYVEDTPRLVQSLVDALVDIFDTVRACVLLQANGAVRAAASHGLTLNVVNALQLTFESGLMRRLEQHAGLVDRDRLPQADPCHKELQALGGRLVAPILTNGRACGAIVLGEKASGAPYAPEEIDLLTTLARCTSAALERAQRLRDSARQQARLDAVLANITAGVITVGADKTITMMNESAERILHLNASDVLGRSVQKLGSAFADIVLRALRDGKPRLRQQIRDVAINADLGLSVTPLGPEGAVAIFSVLPASESDEESDIVFSPLWQFLANRVAQEIKNPMVAINTFAQLLPTKYESEEFRQEFAEIVQKEVGRINDVVEALYEFAGPPRLELTRKDLTEDIRGILGEFEAVLKKKKIAVETEFADQETPVRVDNSQFAQAVRNVIQNSIEAMPDGGILKVATRRENGRCELIISDTGPGITEKDAQAIFTPFFSTKETGMGLGLTMASRILKEHEGSLTLLSTQEGGGRFAMNLPVAKKD